MTSSPGTGVSMASCRSCWEGGGCNTITVLVAPPSSTTDVVVMTVPGAEPKCAFSTNWPTKVEAAACWTGALTGARTLTCSGGLGKA